MKSIKTAACFATASLFAAGSVLAQSDSYAPASHSGGGIGGLVFLAIDILIIVGFWKVFAKAGQPGWSGIIPIYNVYILCKIVGKPWWWLLLCCIPFLGFIFWIIVCIDLAKSFGKGVGFGIGMAFFILFPVLGFSDATYKGPAGA